MRAYKTQSTITDAGQLVISDVPFDAGEEVEIVVRARNGNGAERVRDLRDLFKTAQSLPQIQTLTDEDIVREVEAYRNRR